MAVSGTINVSMSFLDSTTSSGVVSQKKLSLSSADIYTTGKVAVVTGTVGTALQNIDLSSLGYRNAAGEPVAISTVDRCGFISDNEAFVQFVDIDIKLHATDNHMAVTCVHNTDDTVNVYTTNGTSSYTLLLFGD
jgi:hypothetical protein